MTAQNDLVRESRKGADAATGDEPSLAGPKDEPGTSVSVEEDEEDLFDDLPDSGEEEYLDDDLYEGL